MSFILHSLDVPLLFSLYLADGRSLIGYASAPPQQNFQRGPPPVTARFHKQGDLQHSDPWGLGYVLSLIFRGSDGRLSHFFD